MTNEDIQKCINKIDDQDLKKLATFGIFAIEDNWDEIAIKANKEGLQLFAMELLKASQQTKEVILDKENYTIPLNSTAEWINPKSDIKIFYVEQVDQIHEAEKIESDAENIKERFYKYSFFAILIFLGITILVGIWTIGKWLF